MKKLLLLGLLAFFGSEALAQSFRFGAKGGFNYADVNGKKLNDKAHDSKLGWHAGVMVNIQYPGNDWFSLQPELQYTRKGYEQLGTAFNITNSQGNVLYTEKHNALVRFNYLELPFMFNFRTGILVFEAGPTLSYLVGADSDAFITQTLPDGTETSIELPDPGNERDKLSKFDYGAAAGLRLETENGAALGLRFSQNFRKVYDHNDPAIVNPYTNARNQVFQLYISYLIPE